jgi:hypothetical protein
MMVTATIQVRLAISPIHKTPVRISQCVQEIYGHPQQGILDEQTARFNRSVVGVYNCRL